MAKPVRSLFATQIFHAPLKVSGSQSRGLGDFNERLLNECFAYREIDRVGRKWSKSNYPGGYTSYGSLDQLHRQSPTFGRLAQAIAREAKIYAKELGFERSAIQGLELTNLWINIMGRGAHHSSHIHPKSALSGTYYLQLPPGAAGLKLEDPRLQLMMASPPRKSGASAHFTVLKPRVGDLVLFESWLRHEVPQNLLDEERVSVSFNLS